MWTTRFPLLQRVLVSRDPLIVDNWFHALDLSKSFNVVSSHLTGLSLPSFPVGGPASSGVGALWPSSDGKYLYLFGVDLGDSAWRSRLMWRYNIPGGSWSMIATSGAEQVPPIEGASCWIPQCGTNNSGVGVYLGGIIPETSGATGTADEGYVASTLFFDMVFHPSKLDISNVRDFIISLEPPFRHLHHPIISPRLAVRTARSYMSRTWDQTARAS